MLNRKITKRFKTDFKKIKYHTAMVDDLNQIIIMLEKGEPLAEKNKDHELQGIYKGLRECHIRPDLLLIYQKDDNKLILYLLRIGSHSELFKK